MRCPICPNLDTRVIDSRIMQDGTVIRRRRKCDECQNRFTTYEKLELPLPVLVKNDGRRESFDREKIIKSIKKACHKQPISIETIDEIIDNIEKFLMEGQEKEVPAKKIGEYVMAKLYELNPVAYVRFASFYWNYDNIDDFIKVLSQSLIAMDAQHKPHNEEKN